MVESNVTLGSQTLLSVLNATTDLQVTDRNGSSHTVTILQSEVAADCLIIEDQTSCNCSVGFVWSNEVCYTTGCCRETTCKQNVSHIAPLCIPKVNVQINGSVTLSTSGAAWSSNKFSKVVKEIEKLNGLQYINFTDNRTNAVDFEAAVSVKFPTSRLQDVVTNVEYQLTAVVLVDTLGMVTIKTPGTIVQYQSDPLLNCTFEEATDSAGWNMSRPHERFELNNGTVVKLNYRCATEEYMSCVAVTLQKVIGIYEGTYECGFMKGSVRHIAKTYLSVALLPDLITLKINPLALDCSKSSQKDVVVTATILNSPENFKVWWSLKGIKQSELHNTSLNYSLIYTFKASISCQKTMEAQYVNVTFENKLQQIKSARVDIPVIYDGEKFCSEEEINGQYWPKSPSGDTVINRTCPEGRVGFKSRTCDGTTWQPVFSSCVSEELNKVYAEAGKFSMGLGAIQEVAMNIFAGLKNSSIYDSGSDDSMADIGASINILSVMAVGSENVALQEEVFPDFVDAASNMLNKSWGGINSSTAHNMSSDYLQSVEGLVKNIKVKNSSTITSQNVDLKFCSGDGCNVSAFDIGVNLNKSSGIMKTVAVKNLMDKLRNNFHRTKATSLLLSVTLEDSNDTALEITLDFPIEKMKSTIPLCVFWKIEDREWSGEGCVIKSSDGNRTRCECNHLTSFSVLMAKSDISTDILDIITYVGLGVSVCSLLIFLIIETLVWSAVVKTNLSHFRHTAIVNIAVFLLLADCCFLASSFPETLSDSTCLVLTICKHLFFLAMFSWMLCMSVMLVHQLIFVFSPLRKRVFMFLSSIVGYLCPILIVGCSYLYSKYTDKPYYNKDTCWLFFERVLEGSVHAFLLPVGTVILTNVFSMVVVIVTLMKSSVPDGKSDEKETIKSIIKVVVFLTPVFGVTWVIGFFLLILDGDDPMFHVANYSFTILNSFQGLFILITGCIAEQKVRDELFKIIMAKSKGKSDSTKNLNSTTYTKEK
ncbi:adhesion G protein-coupled receptor F4-like [Seriola lalandi dorsalis]|uniref:adhesion G protein-coupled receptor F4-like n=1 Tax=Seriola lalandi dorsalis TaxID=1841481 RepID=UPI000C6F5371|nr:adhesion G protein-coupled receptor F4-like [Seriola lalandi dorsalis]